MKRGCPMPPFRLVISMRTHVVNSWSVGTSSLRQPQMPLNFSPHVLFRDEDPVPHSVISCTCTNRRARQGGQCRFKEHDTKTYDLGALTHTQVHSFTHYPLSHTAQIFFYSTALCGCLHCEDVAAHSVEILGVDMVHQFFFGNKFVHQDQIIFVFDFAHTYCFFLLYCGNSLTSCIQI